jgi:hypothetical protein
MWALQSVANDQLVHISHSSSMHHVTHILQSLQQQQLFESDFHFCILKEKDF